MVAEPIATAPNEALILEYYCACRWHQCCRFERAATSVRRRFMGRTQRSWSVYEIWADSAWLTRGPSDGCKTATH